MWGAVYEEVSVHSFSYRYSSLTQGACMDSPRERKRSRRDRLQRRERRLDARDDRLRHRAKEKKMKEAKRGYAERELSSSY